MNKPILIVVSLSLSACSSLPARTTSTDPVMRVAIDADSISAGSYARLVHALIRSGKFIVVDRSAGFKAVTKEQEIQHTSTRFGREEKYSLWGQLYGVGGIFVGTEQCEQKSSFLVQKAYRSCLQNLSLIDATTGEIIAASEVAQDSDYSISAAWDQSVTEIVQEYPTRFVDKDDLHRTREYSPTLNDYRQKTIPQHSKAILKMEDSDHIK